jgi:hypothetical protein
MIQLKFLLDGYHSQSHIVILVILIIKISILIMILRIVVIKVYIWSIKDTDYLVESEVLIRLKHHFYRENTLLSFDNDFRFKTLSWQILRNRGYLFHLFLL